MPCGGFATMDIWVRKQLDLAKRPAPPLHSPLGSLVSTGGRSGGSLTARLPARSQLPGAIPCELGRGTAEMRKAKSRPEHPPSAAQGAAGDSRVEGGPQQSRQLARLPYYGPQYRGHICRAVGTQPGQCSRRKTLIGGVDDDPTGYERNLMGSSDTGCNMRFHVDGYRARASMKQALFQRIGDRRIHSHDIRVHGARKPLAKRLCPYPVSREKLLSGFDGGGNNQIAFHQTRGQSSGDAEADDA